MEDASNNNHIHKKDTSVSRCGKLFSQTEIKKHLMDGSCVSCEGTSGSKHEKPKMEKGSKMEKKCETMTDFDLERKTVEEHFTTLKQTSTNLELAKVTLVQLEKLLNRKTTKKEIRTMINHINSQSKAATQLEKKEAENMEDKQKLREVSVGLDKAKKALQRLLEKNDEYNTTGSPNKQSNSSPTSLVGKNKAGLGNKMNSIISEEKKEEKEEKGEEKNKKTATDSATTFEKAATIPEKPPKGGEALEEELEGIKREVRKYNDELRRIAENLPNPPSDINTILHLHKKISEDCREIISCKEGRALAEEFRQSPEYETLYDMDGLTQPLIQFFKSLEPKNQTEKPDAKRKENRGNEKDREDRAKNELNLQNEAIDIICKQLSKLHDDNNKKNRWSEKFQDDRGKIDKAIATLLFHKNSLGSKICICCYQSFTSEYQPRESHLASNFWLRKMMGGLIVQPNKYNTRNSIDPILTAEGATLRMQCGECELNQGKIEGIISKNEIMEILLQIHKGFKPTEYPPLPQSVLYKFAIPNIFRCLCFSLGTGIEHKLILLDRLRWELNHNLLKNPLGEFDEPPKESLFVYFILFSGNVRELIKKTMKGIELEYYSMNAITWISPADQTLFLEMSPFVFVVSLKPIDGLDQLRIFNSDTNTNLPTTEEWKKVLFGKLLEISTYTIRNCNKAIDDLVLDEKTLSENPDRIKAMKKSRLSQAVFDTSFPKQMPMDSITMFYTMAHYFKENVKKEDYYECFPKFPEEYVGYAGFEDDAISYNQLLSLSKLLIQQFEPQMGENKKDDLSIEKLRNFSLEFPFISHIYRMNKVIQFTMKKGTTK